MSEPANDRCTCMEVLGEDPNCNLHGTQTDWALANTLPSEWRDRVADLDQEVALLTSERDVFRTSLIATASAVAEHVETILALRKEVESVRDLLTKASGMQIGPSNEGHRIAIYFEDYNEAGKLFAILSDRAALATEAE